MVKPHRRMPLYRRNFGRPDSGEFIVELPAALLALFVLIMIPMLQLASATYRAYVVRTAALEALHRACRADSFMNDIPASDGFPLSPSAQSIFRQYIDQSIKDKIIANGQLQIPNPPVDCVAQPINGGQAIVYTASLQPGQIDTVRNAYFYELRTKATVMPLLPFQSNFFPKIPGLTAPMILDVTGRQMVEKPMGLAN